MWGSSPNNDRGADSSTHSDNQYITIDSGVGEECLFRALTAIKQLQYVAAVIVSLADSGRPCIMVVTYFERVGNQQKRTSYEQIIAILNQELQIAS